MTSRRNFLGSIPAIIVAGALPLSASSDFSKLEVKPEIQTNFKYCLNTSTIRGQNLGLIGDIEIAAKAGYNGVELWLADIRKFINNSGSTADLKSKLKDLGLTFENAIAFSKWIVDDPEQRNIALEEFHKDMMLLAELDCKRIAAPPMGATKGETIDLFRVAERYRAILEIGSEYGVIPALELWGHSVNLHSLGQAMFAAIESKHLDATVIPDIYHLYKGGSDFSGLKLLSKQAISIFHMNDYPQTIKRNELVDADRVFPGDGVAPFPIIVNELKRINPEMVLSLELFNPEYWKMDALEVAKTGLEKMKKVTSI